MALFSTQHFHIDRDHLDTAHLVIRPFVKPADTTADRHQLVIPTNWYPRCRPADKRRRHSVTDVLARVAAKWGAP